MLEQDTQCGMLPPCMTCYCLRPTIHAVSMVVQLSRLRQLLLMHYRCPFTAKYISIASIVCRVRCKHSIFAAGTAEQAGFFGTTGQKARNQQTKYECTRVKLDRFMVCGFAMSHHQFACSVRLAGSTMLHSDPTSGF